MSDTANALPAGPTVRSKLSRDDIIMRGGMVVIALYLIVTLALPLYAMLSKSLSTSQFDLGQFEVQVSDEAGAFSGNAVSFATLNSEMDLLSDEDLVTGSDGRLGVTQFFPDFSFRSPVLYKIRSTVDTGRFLVGSKLHTGTEWVELDSNTFRRVQLRPVQTTGVGNFVKFFSTPALSNSIRNSLWIAVVSTVITVTLAFWFAYALNRSCMRFKGFFRLVAMAPILVPSLLPGIALVYLFGNQGMIKEVLFGASIYGPIGIIIGSVFFTLPHAFIIISTALAISDARLYEAAVSLRASSWRTFWTVTIPGARYGLISAAFVVFNLVITDFGLPKVIGGQFNVLAVDIYKQVIGQQNFEMGAVVSVVLVVPAIVAFAVDRLVQSKQVALLSARSVPFQPTPDPKTDRIFLVYCSVVAFFIIGMLAVCQFAALIKFWPYDLSFSLRNFDFNRMDGGGWSSYFNSIKLGLLTAVVGTSVVFFGAYLVEKSNGFTTGRSIFQMFAMLPMAIPGMVLGLSYIFFFNDPANPLNVIYGHDDDPGHLHGDPLLHRLAPDGGDGSEADGPGIRIGLRLTQAAHDETVCPGHRAGLPAGYPRHLDLSLHQRHDDCFGGGVPLLAQDNTRLGRGSEHGRCRRHRPGRRHGHDDLLHQRRRPHPAPDCVEGYSQAHAGLAVSVGRSSRQ